MGGRGSSGAVVGSGASELIAAIPKLSASELKSASRGQLETVATAIFIKTNIGRGLAASEAARRARALMSGNTSAQLRSYIKRYG